MSNAWDRMGLAVEEAKSTLGAADTFAKNMARLLRGRLRRVDSESLVALKRELREFDAHRKVWKS